MKSGRLNSYYCEPQINNYNQIYQSGNLSFKFQGVKFGWNCDQDYRIEVITAEMFQQRKEL